MIKLYSLLFEQLAKNINNFSAPRFALNVDTEANLIVLYDTLLFKNGIDYIAGVLETTPSEEGCLNARQVTAVARGDGYPGAGKLMYQISSQLYNLPITSDRFNGSSPAAKSMWDKIESDPNFTRVSVLDNYFEDSNKKRHYIDFTTENPRLLPSPATPNPEDDCPLPQMGSLQAAINKLGTDSAFKVNGSPVNIGELTARHEEFIKTQAPEAATQIIKKAEALFNSKYNQ